MGVFTKIFLNLPQLLVFNFELLKDFEERINNWDTRKKIADVLVKKGPFLKLYLTYINGFENTIKLLDEICIKHPAFGRVVKDFEILQPKCLRMSIKVHMLKPVQRLPQYKLLLNNYLKTQGEDSVDFEDTIEALRIVTEATEAGNNSIKIGKRVQKMLDLQSRLGDDFKLIEPGRELLKEGELVNNTRDGGAPYLILLSDCLLYTKYQGRGKTPRLKVIHSFNLDTVTLCVLNEEFMEFSIVSNIHIVTMRVNCIGERKDWMEAINEGIENYRIKKSSFHCHHQCQCEEELLDDNNKKKN